MWDNRPNKEVGRWCCANLPNREDLTFTDWLTTTKQILIYIDKEVLKCLQRKNFSASHFIYVSVLFFPIFYKIAKIMINLIFFYSEWTQTPLPNFFHSSQSQLPFVLHFANQYHFLSDAHVLVGLPFFLFSIFRLPQVYSFSSLLQIYPVNGSLLIHSDSITCCTFL